MSAADWASIVVLALTILALGNQIKRLGQWPIPRRFMQVCSLIYFAVIYTMTLTPDPGYLIRAGFMTKLGMAFLLITIIADKGDC